jgi:hypothetical protein
MGLYSQHLIIFVAYEWAQQARELDYTRPERLFSDKTSSLLGPFVSYVVIRKPFIINVSSIGKKPT